MLVHAAAEVFRAIASGVLNVGTPRVYALEAAGDAHRATEAREMSGAFILTPDGT